MAKKILVLPGDGVGPKVISAAVSVLESATDDVDFTYGDIGLTAYDKTENYLPAETIDLATDSDAIIAGVIIDRPKDIAYRNPLRVLKKQLNMYAIVRKFFPLCETLGTPGIDLILMTGNPDSLMNVIEKENIDGVTIERYMSKNSCKKLFKKTMEVAEIKQRKTITCAHRTSLFPISDGMFTDLFYKEFAASEFLMNDLEIDAAASELSMNPKMLDVIVSTDLYGISLAGVAAGMVGGSYLTPMGSIGDSTGLFEPMYGPKLEMAEKGFVNPTSAILSSAMALDQIGHPLDAENVRKAVREVYSKGKVTPDVGGTSTTDEFTNFVIDVLKRNK